ncbi:dienelactone hydrolase family protein [Sphingomonas sp. BT-65]|uniref:dienelactone hydrolase family protein n=1 Tax=Sphingomonas sp. BT-65 TaxID=2989821 RepID=UPI0022359916|nr:dienelactone hydrolase family protein [Sphingomonas sp. BT-65]MCW4463189.1 dienelactone hydrolase family protein [Sphingomonas sp. BT-65]
MCDELTDADNARLFGKVSRREFTGMTGAAALTAMLPAPANAKPLKGRDITIKTPDGVAQAYFVAPDKGKHPAVLVWPDIGGLRPSFRKMGERLAQSGYAVLTVNQFYRSAPLPIVKEGETWSQPEIRAKLMEWRKLLTADAVMRDAVAFAAFLDKQPEVNTKRGMGTTGYCMGGPMVMQTAAAVPGRIRAGASFHGGGLATDRPDSPHLLVPKMKASFLFAVAENDDQRNPNEKETLRKAFADAGLPAEIEVYAGAMHGWCPPDSPAYNQVQAEKAWGRLLALFGKALA